MRRTWVLGALAIAFVAIVASRLTELETLTDTLARGRWQWVLAAGGLQMLYFGALALLYQSAFLAVDVPSRGRDLIGVLLASLFVNTLAPSGGLAGSALLIGDTARRGQPAARAAAGALLARITDSVGFTGILLLGLTYLFLRRDLRPYEIGGALSLLGGTALLAVLLVAGLRRPAMVQGLLEWTQRAISAAGARIGRPDPLPAEWAAQHADEFARAGAAIGERPLRLVRAVAVALCAHFISLASLFALFLAFYRPVEFGLLAAGYAVAILFWKMSPIPEGVGLVEGVMVVVYTSLGLPTATATLIALGFRGLIFWIPLLVGFLMIRRLRVFRPRPHAVPP